MAATGLLSLARVSGTRHNRIKLEDISSFFQQLSTMVNAGTPLLHALRLSADQAGSEQLARIGKDMANRVASGEALYQAAAAYPDVFASHWVQMIRTGEVSGQLGALLVQLRQNLQKSQATRNQVISALTYPAILLVIAMASLFIMLWKVVPTFAEFFKDFGTTLPPITQFTVSFSNFVQEYALVIIAAVALAVYSFRRWIATDAGNRTFRSLVMATPLVGDLYVQAAMERFAANLALLLKAGIPLLEALRTTQEVFREDGVYHLVLAQVYREVSRGASLGGALDHTGLFTPMVLSMVRVGEESGKLAEVLEQVAAYYRDRVEFLVGRFTQVVEPMIVIGMGVIVGGLLASIYIPMFQLAAGPK